MVGIAGIARKIVRLLRSKKIVEVPKTIDGKHILAGKIALITGGSSGIGFAMARKFVDEGAKVIISGRNEDKLRKCQNELGSDAVKSLVLDVTNVDSLPNKVKDAVALYGRIDILVNSAGVGDKKDFLNTTEDDYDQVMDVNMKGTFFMSQSIAKYMIENRIKGHILNLASSSSNRPAWNAYQISKWGVKGFTIGLADTLIKHGIIVNAIAPGPTATPFMGLKNGENETITDQPTQRYAYPSEIADLAAFMVSDYGNLIVGDTYFISGGSGITTLHY